MPAAKHRESAPGLRSTRLCPRHSAWLPPWLFIFACLVSLHLQPNAPAQSSESEARLRNNSPFLPPGYEKSDSKPKPKPQPNRNQPPISEQIEFRGITKFDGAYQFSIFHKQEKKSYWIREGERKAGIAAQSFEPDSQTVVVNFKGRSERLPLTDASDSPRPVASGESSSRKLPDPGGSARRSSNQSSGSSGDKPRVVPRRRVILPDN